MHEIWVEKYRPQTLEEVVGHPEIVERLKSYAKTGNMPHLMFAGPAGTGKTTSALALARTLYKENWAYNFHELNASVAPETPLLVRVNGAIRRTTFAELAEFYFRDGRTRHLATPDLEVLSLDPQLRVKFMRASSLIRHRKSEIATIEHEGGVIRTTLDHSVFVLGEDARPKAVPVSQLRPGDHLLSFKTKLEGRRSEVSLAAFEPRPFLVNGVPRRNPRLGTVLQEMPLDEGLSRMFGLFMAEGCTSLSAKGTSGQFIYAFGYPKEKDLAEAVREFWSSLGCATTTSLGRSGFDRSRKSSIQVRALNTQLVRFARRHFYDGRGHVAGNKRIPSFMLDAPLEARLAFLRGYWEGDGSGPWGRVARLSSVSQDALIDAAWVGRVSGVETSCFDHEARLIWPNASFSYTRSDLLPSRLGQALVEKAGLGQAHALRHSLYGKRSSSVSKKVLASLLDKVERPTPFSRSLRKLVESDLHSVKITKVTVAPYSGWVYDLSVPGSQAFWGGQIPVLLHNSDERGIGIVRGKIKDFARTKPMGDAAFKIIFLDEADALTGDAQSALRRTMERYAQTCRFVLSCNYSSKIIEPIQSRCALFRFRPLKPEEIKTLIRRIAKEEKLEITADGIEAIIYVARGDLRKAINTLQVAASGKKTINEDAVYETTSTAHPDEIRGLVETALKGDFLAARGSLEDLLIQYGMSGEDVIRQVHRAIFDLPLPDKVKVRLIDRVGEAEFRLVEGSNERVQIEALLAHFVLVGGELKTAKASA